jgi:hypothetical protein
MLGHERVAVLQPNGVVGIRAPLQAPDDLAALAPRGLHLDHLVVVRVGDQDVPVVELPRGPGVLHVLRVRPDLAPLPIELANPVLVAHEDVADRHARLGDETDRVDDSLREAGAAEERAEDAQRVGRGALEHAHEPVPVAQEHAREPSRGRLRRRGRPEEEDLAHRAAFPRPFLPRRQPEPDGLRVDAQELSVGGLVAGIAALGRSLDDKNVPRLLPKLGGGALRRGKAHGPNVRPRQRQLPEGRLQDEALPVEGVDSPAQPGAVVEPDLLRARLGAHGAVRAELQPGDLLEGQPSLPSAGAAFAEDRDPRRPKVRQAPPELRAVRKEQAVRILRQVFGRSRLPFRRARRARRGRGNGRERLLEGGQQQSQRDSDPHGVPRR